MLCHAGWAVTKIIPLPPGRSIVPLQRAEPTLGNPLKCLFGPVAGDPHLTDTMRKGKRHPCRLSPLGLSIYGCGPWLLPVVALDQQERCKGCPVLPVPHNPGCCSPRHRSSPGVPGLPCQAKQSRGAMAEPWPKASLFSGHQQHTVTTSDLGLRAH